MTPSILDYHSPTSTYALAFSPLSNSTADLKLAVGSYVESNATSAKDGTGGGNSVTIIGLDRSYLEMQDEESDSALDVDEDEVMVDSARARRSPLPPNPHPSSSRSAFTHSRSGSYSSSGSAFVPVARVSHAYPPTALAFSPAQLSSSLQSSNVGTAGEGTREMVASSSDCLRLWDLQADESGAGKGSKYVGERGRSNSGQPGAMKLVPRAVLANSKTEYSAPLTSFSWSTMETTHIVTSSIDTTCTVWDIATSVPITQLIAHDREVYDVAWSPSTRDVFASVGADGSVRMFDLRALEHSTILYEATAASSSTKTSNSGAGPSPRITSSTASPAVPTPLLRLAFSPTAPTYLSVCHADSAEVQILDTRSPGTPAMEVRGHTACVNGMVWGGSTMSSHTTAGNGSSGPGWLATCSDDSTLLLWDLSSATSSTLNVQSSSSSRPAGPAVTKILRDPVYAYTAPSEVNSVAWSFKSGGGSGEWVAIGCGRLVRCLR